MASAAQITANQANARLSTRPRTAEGKAASAQNNTSHGLCSRQFVILAGEEKEFADFMTELHAAIQPEGAIERDLFTQHAHEMAERLKRIDLYARRAERTYHKTINLLQSIQSPYPLPALVDPIQVNVDDGNPVNPHVELNNLPQPKPFTPFA